MSQRCSRCKKLFPLTEDFFCRNKARPNGFSNLCKSCHRQLQRNYQDKLISIHGIEKVREMRNTKLKRWRKNNPEASTTQRRKARKLFKLRHPERVRESRRKWFQTPNGKRTLQRAVKKYQQSEKGKESLKRSMNKFFSKEENRIISNLRSRVTYAVSGKAGLFINGKIENFVGCSRFRLIQHLQSFWQEGMTWDNYGQKKGQLTWHVDHIVPFAHFKEEFRSGDIARIQRASKLVNHYTNLFPMWGPENQSKGAKKPEWVLIMGKTMTSDLHAKYLNLDLSDSPDEPDPEDS